MCSAGKLRLLSVIGIVIGAAVITAGQHTAVQATAGSAVYQANCAGCHMPDLGGRNEAPQLAGSNFINAWGRRSTRELLNTIQTTMPPGRPASLPPSDYFNVTAFILASNGAVAGSELLTGETNVVISNIAKGTVTAISATPARAERTNQ